MRRVVLAALALALGAAPALASSGAELPRQTWSFDGVFGRFDRPSLQRGLQVYEEVCASCHALQYVAFRNLADLGFSEEQVKAIAAGYEIEDGPNADGDMFTRPGRPSDRFPAPFPNDQAARAANNGALPPNLSLIAKARADGPNYIYGILTGYRDPPANAEIGEGMYFNPSMAGCITNEETGALEGCQIAMPPPLAEGQVTYADGTPATVEQMSRDVVQFLTWAAEPTMEERKNAGAKTMIFLVILTALLYAAKRKVWASAH
jgi:ubiquinol-cytochrome c reductase cytochrome c1 subunit